MECKACRLPCNRSSKLQFLPIHGLLFQSSGLSPNRKLFSKSSLKDVYPSVGIFDILKFATFNVFINENFDKIFFGDQVGSLPCFHCFLYLLYSLKSYIFLSINQSFQRLIFPRLMENFIILLIAVKIILIIVHVFG